MKISVVTAVYNRAATIEASIDSASLQTGVDLEHIVVDGMSNDGTYECIQKNQSKLANVIHEPDDGIYDALNKGILAATGEVVGFLHADDLFADANVLSRIEQKFSEDNFDAVYGDLVYVDSDRPDKVIRYWKSGPYSSSKFRRGWMPPHPTVYVRKSIYEKFGMYRTDLGSAADYECLVRLLVKHNIRVGYVPHILVRMRVGGESNASLRNRLQANSSDRQAWLENDLAPPFGLQFTKPLSKIPQYFRRPPSDSN